ncbi:hypothetical protein ABVT39_001823, partial [Epinephelus coioides]
MVDMTTEPGNRAVKKRQGRLQNEQRKGEKKPKGWISKRKTPKFEYIQTKHIAVVLSYDYTNT